MNGCAGRFPPHALLAWILLLAASTSVDLVNEVYQIPASEWRYVELSLNQQPALVRAEFRVEDGPDAKCAWR